MAIIGGFNQMALVAQNPHEVVQRAEGLGQRVMRLVDGIVADVMADVGALAQRIQRLREQVGRFEERIDRAEENRRNNEELLNHIQALVPNVRELYNQLLPPMAPG